MTIPPVHGQRSEDGTTRWDEVCMAWVEDRNWHSVENAHGHPLDSLPAERDEPTGQEVVEANVSAFLDLQRLRQAAEDWRYSDEWIGSSFRAWVAATRERNGQ